ILLLKTHLPGLTRHFRDTTTTSIIKVASNALAMMLVMTELAHRSSEFSAVILPRVLGLNHETAKEAAAANRPVTEAWHSTTNALPVRSCVKPWAVSSVPRLAWVDSRE